MSSRPAKSRIIEPQFLLMAYCNGYFPMADSKTGEIGWYSPDPRAVFDLNEFKTPRSLKQTIRKKNFDIRVDNRFEQVIRACGGRNETWISEDIIQTYLELHRLGFAHSVESWKEGKLAGGLYGVAVGGAFFGESMFSIDRDASKVALAFLVKRMSEHGFTLLDTQWVTPHLARFGAKEIPRAEYLDKLKKAIQQKCRFI